MRKPLITLGVLLIAGGFVSLEYFFSPDQVAPVASSETLIANITGENGENTVTRFDVPLSQVSEKNFELVGMNTVTRRNSNTVEHLFGSIILTLEQDNLAVMKSDFFAAEEETMLVSIYEIFPTYETTTSKAFFALQNIFEKKFLNDVEVGINRTDEFGMFSFYFNAPQAPERAMIVTVTKDRLLGFEYLKTNHERLLPLIEQLAPKLNNN